MIDNFRPRVDLNPSEYSDIAEYSLGSGEVLANIISRYVVGNPQAINFVRSYKKVGCKVKDENIWLDFVVNNDGSQTVFYWLPTNNYVCSLSDLYDLQNGSYIREYKNVELSGITLNGANAFNTGYMFEYSNSVSLDLTDVSLGQSCNTISLKNINGEIVGLNSLNTSNIGEFSMDNSTLSYLDISGWDLSNTYSINISDVDITSGNINMSGLTIGERTDKRYLFNFGTDVTYNVSNWNFTGNIGLSSTFENIYDVSFEGLNTWDVSSMGSFERMLYCADLDELDLSNWNVTGSFDAGVTSGYFVNDMFGGAQIDNLYLTNWTVPFGFAGETYLPFNDFRGTLHVDGWTFSNPQESTPYGISYLFYTGYYLIDGLDTWDVSNVTNMESLFSGFHDTNFSSIIEQLEDWNVSSVTNFDNAFYNIDDLTDFSALDSWRNYINPNASFENCCYTEETVTDVRYPEWNGWFTPDGTFHPCKRSQYVNGIYFKGIVNNTRPSNPQIGWAITEIKNTPTYKYYIYDGTTWEEYVAPAPPAYIEIPIPPDTYWYLSSDNETFYALQPNSAASGYHVEVFNEPNFGDTSHLGYYINDNIQYTKDTRRYVHDNIPNMYWQGAAGTFTDIYDLTPSDGQQSQLYTQANRSAYIGYYTYITQNGYWTFDYI